MKSIDTGTIHFTPWHLRERTRVLRNDLASTIQSNFFYSFLFLPKYKREAIIDVYRFCRAVDDVVDEIPQGAADGGTASAIEKAQAELDEWRREIERLYQGRPQKPLGARLLQVLERFPMPQEYFEEMVAGCEMDLHRNRYATFDELYRYCYRVASITGLMSIEIFTYNSPQTREYAVNLGIALQLTNIIRDISEDASRNRIYLPLEDLERFGYSEEDLFNRSVGDNFRRMMEFQCARAQQYYDSAYALLPEVDRPTLTAAITMGRIYHRLLERIERVDYDVYNNQIRLHRPERFLIALSEWGKARLSGGSPAGEGGK